MTTFIWNTKIMMKNIRSLLYKQKEVIWTVVDGVLPVACAVYLRYTSVKFYFTFLNFYFSPIFI